MKRLVIAIDCDDVLVPSTEQIVAMYNHQFGTIVQLEGAHTSKNPAWQADRETIGERIYDIQLTEEYAQTPPFQDAVEACRRLSELHELHLVTARPEKIMSVTKRMLDLHFNGIFQEIEHVGLDGNKGEICKKLQADVLIDDNYKHLLMANECQIPSLIWFGDYAWQTATEQDPNVNVMRCKDWQGVEQEISRIANV